MRIVLLLLLCLGLTGCATVRPNSYAYNAWSYRYEYKDYEIEIISEPQGAKVEWNNGYLGVTPLKLTLNGAYDSVVLKLYPNEVGQYTQTKYLSYLSPIPRKIYFNMNLAPVSKEYDININR